MKIEQNRNYGRFTFDVTNRPINTDSPAVRKLRSSMKHFGWLPAYPAHCVLEGAFWKIKDGQHRFAIAKELGLPVVFVVTERDDVSIPEINSSQRAWTLGDYVGSYIQQKVADYRELLEFSQRTGFSLTCSAGLLIGRTSGDGGATRQVRDGSFRIRNREEAERTASLVLTVVEHGADWATKQLSVTALASCLHVEQFSLERFEDKLKKYPHLLRDEPTLKMMLEMYENLYNFSAQIRCPLAFLAREASKGRSPIKGGPAMLQGPAGPDIEAVS